MQPSSPTRNATAATDAVRRVHVATPTPPAASQDRIPFNRQAIVGNELEYMRQALSGVTSGDGLFTKKCHALIEQLTGCPKVLLTTSCTHALELSALLLDLDAGDEVILPAFTFVSTANAFALRGARPIFVDVRPDTLNLDERLVPDAITPRTRAIVPVHYAGVGCAMDVLCDLAQRRNLAIVEDNAHGLLGRYRGRQLGTFGGLATQSFHETKNFSCGEGGALLINDRSLIERAEIIREKGTNRSRFFRGQVDKYTWVDLGSSLLPSDVLAAMLLAQLEQHEMIQSHRRRVCERYAAELADWAASVGARLPIVPPECEPTYHLWYLRMPSLDARQALIEHLKACGVSAVFHYQPLHLSEMGRRFGGLPGQCPVTERVADELVRLPLFNDMSEADQGRVIEAVRSFGG